MRQWTPEERLRQSELIKRWKPWKTAGVKTREGKEISKMNAYKHGERSANFKNISQVIAKYTQFLDFFKDH